MFETGKKYKRYIVIRNVIHEGPDVDEDFDSIDEAKEFCEKYTPNYTWFQVFDCETRQSVFETTFNDIIERVK